MQTKKKKTLLLKTSLPGPWRTLLADLLLG